MVKLLLQESCQEIEDTRGHTGKHGSGRPEKHRRAEKAEAKGNENRTEKKADGKEGGEKGSGERK